MPFTEGCFPKQTLRLPDPTSRAKDTGGVEPTGRRGEADEEEDGVMASVDCSNYTGFPVLLQPGPVPAG